MIEAARLAGLEFNSREPQALARFYIEALGFELLDMPRPGVGQDASLMLGLGKETIRLRQALPTARPYPADVPGWSPLFQHIAIVVADMSAAYARLCAQPAWTAISTEGPEQLPKSSGGVGAFKFRDPEGHPLELLAYPEDDMPEHWAGVGHNAPYLGIDHSAISVADTARSLAFYAKFGFERQGGSHNRGVEQSRLDRTEAADVEVTSLIIPGAPHPHLELLCYRGPFGRRSSWAEPSDIASTRTVLAGLSPLIIRHLSAKHAELLASGSDKDGSVLLHDPDGHLIRIEWT
ncbi:MAG: glyoxalase [Beijerinckiaceae bacterium]|nr:glyoxalase [Beijerinckiaceae bacterium]